MKTMMKLVSVAAVLMLAITNCNQEPPDIPVEAPGNVFKIDMTDSPANYGRVDIEMTEIDVYHDVRGWIPLYTSVRSMNILTLANGTSRNIAYHNNVMVGHYSKVRILFANRNSITLNAPVVLGGIDYEAGTTLPLKWMHSSFYVEVPIDKQITPERGARLLLDFDVETSITEGLTAFQIDPSISVMLHTTTGLKGIVAGGSAPAFISIDNGLHVYSAYADRAGNFLVRGVAEGEYHLIIRVMKRDPVTGLLFEKSYQMDDVPIVNEKIRDLGTIRM